MLTQLLHQQRTTSLGPKAVPAGNIDGDWTHDLHGTVNGGGRRGGGGGGLAARISAPESKFAPAATNRRAERRAEQRAAKVAAAIARSDTMADVQMTSAPPISTVTVNKGLSIRGLAGPFAVMAQNFAPGTTAADIESAMTPVGGEMLSCRIVKTSPLLVAEMVFATKEGGDAVISTFNNQTVRDYTPSDINLKVLTVAVPIGRRSDHQGLPQAWRLQRDRGAAEHQSFPGREPLDIEQCHRRFQRLPRAHGS